MDGGQLSLSGEDATYDGFLRPKAELLLQEIRNPSGVSGATFSWCNKYRYHLWRRWGEGKVLTYLMCNPSKSDVFSTDPIMRKCLFYAKKYGYAGVDLLGIFALMSAKIKGLEVDDPVGADNDEFIKAVRGDVCFAWGKVGSRVKHQRDRPYRVIKMIDESVNVMCLGVTKDGNPKHPCYLSHGCEFVPFDTPIGNFRTVASPKRVWAHLNQK